MRVSIYQINIERDSKGVVFSSFNQTKKINNTYENKVDRSIYDKVFEGDVNCKDLEDVYRLFNVDIPEMHYGRSMSVSDVVVTEVGAFFCDMVGFERLSSF